MKNIFKGNMQNGIQFQSFGIPKFFKPAFSVPILEQIILCSFADKSKTRLNAFRLRNRDRGNKYIQAGSISDFNHLKRLV